MEIDISCFESDKENYCYARAVCGSSIKRNRLINLGHPDLNCIPHEAFSQYKTVREIYENEIENILTHETLHHVLYEFIKEEPEAYLRLDYIDTLWRRISDIPSSK